MPSTSHCHISGLLQLDSITSAPNDFSLTCTASIHAVSLNVNNGSISVNLTYYNNLRELFSNEVVVFCSGTLLVTESFDGCPQLSIKARILIRFVIYEL
jgi:hypothetical protein